MDLKVNWATAVIPPAPEPVPTRPMVILPIAAGLVVLIAATLVAVVWFTRAS